jgi:hypothetical protein
MSRVPVPVVVHLGVQVLGSSIIAKSAGETPLGWLIPLIKIFK